MYFIYDGTYPGFLSAVYEIYHFGTSRLEGIAPDNGEGQLFGMTYMVDTRYLHAEQVAAAFEKNAAVRHSAGCTAPSFPTKRGKK